MSSMCDMRTRDGKCSGEFVRTHHKIYAPSRCNKCGHHGYKHLSMQQLLKHKDRNSDLLEEYMERAWDEHELEMKAKEDALTKKATDMKTALMEEAKIASAVADAKKLTYISHVDIMHKNRRLEIEKTTTYFREAYEVLVKEPSLSNNISKIAILQLLEHHDIEKKVALLFASGLPAVIKCMSQKSEHDDKVMSSLRVAATKVKILWRVAIVSSPAVVRLVKSTKDADGAVQPQHAPTGDKKCSRKIADTDRHRLTKKFKTAARDGE